ncbi:39S ribosomal protein L21, mitochondrial [Frankliniella fusca]|uniref:Large ribosomal subunit protein bL21m n=1 Tax=Frankliniella fusca TaxID=407009 RepID=A0AAE1HTM2_9NEOP|nr:39S ribosomal protein L21, mitochondrial [Frankliniella fusca]
MAGIRGLTHCLVPTVNTFLQKTCANFTSICKLQPGVPTFSPRFLPTLTSVAGLRTHSVAKRTAQPFPKAPPHQQNVVDTSQEELEIIEDVISKVNHQIANKSHGRLFAVVQLFNRQWKITPEDVLVVEGYWPPNIGDTIRLEKVLLVGSSDFSLVGMPLLRPDLVNIQATVIEKRLSHTHTHFKKKMRKQYQRINFYRHQHTMIRINSIELTSCINERKDIEGLDGRVF